MRIALISDLHGNAVSLDAVLADIDRHGVDQVVCLGDTATLGPRPREVLGMLQDRGCRCIMGNHDAFLLDEELIRTYSEVPIVVDSVTWCRDLMTASDLAFVSTFETGFRVELGPKTSALLYHGSPRSHMEDLLATMSAEEVDEALAGQKADVMAGGHTHIQMMRQHRGTLLVNPGSVGMPFLEFANGCAPCVMPYAEYAVIEASKDDVQVSLKRVAVDRAKLRNDCEASSSPICRALEKAYS